MPLWVYYAVGKVGIVKPPYPDYVPRDQIRAYLFKHTGTLVSKQRITKWIKTGEIRMISVPRRGPGGGYYWYTRKSYLDDLVTRYS